MLRALGGRPPQGDLLGEQAGTECYLPTHVLHQAGVSSRRTCSSFAHACCCCRGGSLSLRC